MRVQGSSVEVRDRRDLDGRLQKLIGKKHRKSKTELTSEIVRVTEGNFTFPFPECDSDYENRRSTAVNKEFYSTVDKRYSLKQDEKVEKEKRKPKTIYKKTFVDEKGLLDIIEDMGKQEEEKKQKKMVKVKSIEAYLDMKKKNAKRKRMSDKQLVKAVRDKLKKKASAS